MVRSEYDYWLLDLDGTLVDVEWPYIREMFDRVGDRLGREFDDGEAETLWYGIGGDRDAELARQGLDRMEFWTAFDEVEHPDERVEATTLYEDAAFLADLECPTGIVTHSHPELAGPVLEHLDIADWFDTLVCCSDELGWKPDPKPVERAKGQLGVGEGTPGVLAGDGANDVGAAWNAGLDAIHVERLGTDRRGRIVEADYQVESFDEIV